MRNIVWAILLVVAATRAQKYKFCAPAETVNENACYSLQRGDSDVSCLRVADSAECAIRLAEGEADFGVFNAEELLLTYQSYSDNIRPILQLRHKDKLNEEYEFQTVAVVSADLTQANLPPGERLKRLRNGGLCHPGFSKAQRWNDYILKYFENKVNPMSCRDNETVIENEVKNLRDFFGKACRPGDWTPDSSFDKELKAKYPELCQLCDSEDCNYSNKQKHGHYGALDCLADGKGKVAFVALSYVQEYLKTNESYQFLCPSGNIQPLTTPCAWLKQPWSVIVSRNEIADILKSKLFDWLKITSETDAWKIALNKIIQEDSRAIDMERITMATYLSRGRDIDFGNTDNCRIIRWCTTSDVETNKCMWISKAATALGISPTISCVKTISTYHCFNEIANDRADIIAIDSNYGHLARTIYGLSTILYSETDASKNNVINAVVRGSNDANSVKSFDDLKNRKACFPEYGGITWLSFVNIARTDGFISSKNCDYASLLSKFFSGACTPGVNNTDHSGSPISPDISAKLCSVCQHQNNTSCEANASNHYYGDKGAMRCLSEGAGDVAFVEVSNIIEDGTIDSKMYRVLCKNGSLAQTSGFVLDEYCALSVTIDSEVVTRKNNSQIFTNDIIRVLLKIEDWLGYRVNARRPIHIYGPFNGIRDLLFKDSTSGLVTTSSTKKTVLAYKELFSHVETCWNGSFAVIANFTFVALVALYHILSSHVH